MALFHFGKKKEEKGKETPVCACGCGCTTEETAEKSNDCCCGNTQDSISSVKVLGAGCKSCHQQYEQAKAAIKNMGLDIEVEYITDMEKVMAYGAMSMPAIVVNEKVVSAGKVLKASDLETQLHKLGF